MCLDSTYTHYFPSGSLAKPPFFPTLTHAHVFSFSLPFLLFLFLPVFIFQGTLSQSIYL